MCMCVCVSVCVCVCANLIHVHTCTYRFFIRHAMERWGRGFVRLTRLGCEQEGHRHFYTTKRTHPRSQRVASTHIRSPLSPRKIHKRTERNLRKKKKRDTEKNGAVG